jgi:hypothetical protein
MVTPHGKLVSLLTIPSVLPMYLSLRMAKKHHPTT